MKVFCSETILLQHSVLNHRIDLYFPRHKLAIEVDEKGQKGRDNHKEIERENTIKNILIVNLLELNFMKSILTCMMKLVKYTIAVINHLKYL